MIVGEDIILDCLLILFCFLEDAPCNGNINANFGWKDAYLFILEN